MKITKNVNMIIRCYKHINKQTLDCYVTCIRPFVLDIVKHKYPSLAHASLLQCRFYKSVYTEYSTLYKVH